MHERVAQGQTGRTMVAILAAGVSRRFGSPKQLFQLNGTTLVCRAAIAALAASVDEVSVVVGAHADLVAPVLEGLPAAVVKNDTWEQGQSTSVRAALAAARRASCDLLALLPVDMAFVDARHLGALVNTARRGGCSAVSLGPCGTMAPCAFQAADFALLDDLRGDAGALKVARRLMAAGCATGVAFSDARMAFDIDTVEDARAACDMLADKGALS